MVAGQAKLRIEVYSIHHSHDSVEETEVGRHGPGSHYPGLRLQIPWPVSTLVDRNPLTHLPVVEFIPEPSPPAVSSKLTLIVRNPACTHPTVLQAVTLTPTTTPAERHVSFRKNGFSATQYVKGQASSCSSLTFVGRQRESLPGPASDSS